MTEKEKILKRLLKENKITFEEMLILQKEQTKLNYPKWDKFTTIQPILSDWTYRPEHLPYYTVTCKTQ